MSFKELATQPWQQSPALGQAVLAQLVSHSTSVHRPHQDSDQRPMEQKNLFDF